MAKSRQVPNNDHVKPAVESELEGNEGTKPKIKTGIKSGPEMDIDNGL